VVKTEFKNNGSLGSILLFLLSIVDFILGGFNESDFLISLGLRRVFLKELEKILTLVSFNGALELVNHGGNLKSGKEDSLLSLQNDVFGPSDESGQISLVLDISSDSEVSGSSLEKRVLNFLNLFGGFLLNTFSHFSSLAKK